MHQELLFSALQKAASKVTRDLGNFHENCATKKAQQERGWQEA